MTFFAVHDPEHPPYVTTEEVPGVVYADSTAPKLRRAVLMVWHKIAMEYQRYTSGLVYGEHAEDDAREWATSANVEYRPCT